MSASSFDAFRRRSLRHFLFGIALAFASETIDAQRFDDRFFQTYAPTTMTPTGAMTAAADFDLSGADDIAIAFATPPAGLPSALVGLYVDPGRTAAGVTAIEPIAIVTTADIPSAVGARGVLRAEWSGDGIPDLVVVVENAAGDSEYWCAVNNLGAGFGPFTLATTIAPSTTTGGPAGNTALRADRAAAVGDFNGDSIDDLAIGENRVTIVFTPAGTTTVTSVSQILLLLLPFGTPMYSEVRPPTNALGSFATGDINGDASTDLFFQWDGVPARVIYGTPTGAFVPSVATVLSLAGAARAHAAIGDLNGDGNAEVAVASTSGSVFPAWSLTAVDGLAISVPGTAVPLATSVAGFRTASLDLSDFDRDGRGDIYLSLMTSASSRETNLYRNNSSPTFVRLPPANIAAAVGPIAATFDQGNQGASDVFGDFDGDGDRDHASIGAPNPAVVPQQPFLLSLRLNRSIYGSPTPGQFNVPAIDLTSASVTNSAFSLSVRDGLPFSGAVILPSFGRGQGGNGIWIDPAPGNFIAINGGLWVVPLDVTGEFSMTTSLVGLTWLIGTPIYFQAAVVDPTGGLTTMGVSFSLSSGRLFEIF